MIDTSAHLVLVYALLRTDTLIILEPKSILSNKFLIPMKWNHRFPTKGCPTYKQSLNIPYIWAARYSSMFLLSLYAHVFISVSSPTSCWYIMQYLVYQTFNPWHSHFWTNGRTITLYPIAIFISPIQPKSANPSTALVSTAISDAPRTNIEIIESPIPICVDRQVLLQHQT